MPVTLSEVTGPRPSQITLGAHAADLTAGFAGEPLGERIIVSGRVLDENGAPVRNSVVEVWQCNAAGRYQHEGDRHDAPLDPNFRGTGQADRRARALRLQDHQARRLSVAQPLQTPGGRRISIFRYTAMASANV